MRGVLGVFITLILFHAVLAQQQPKVVRAKYSQLENGIHIILRTDPRISDSSERLVWMSSLYRGGVLNEPLGMPGASACLATAMLQNLHGTSLAGEEEDALNVSVGQLHTQFMMGGRFTDLPELLRIETVRLNRSLPLLPDLKSCEDKSQDYPFWNWQSHPGFWRDLNQELRRRESLPRSAAGDLKALATEIYRPSNLTLTIVSNVESRDVEEVVWKHLSLIHADNPKVHGHVPRWDLPTQLDLSAEPNRAALVLYKEPPQQPALQDLLTLWGLWESDKMTDGVPSGVPVKSRSIRQADGGVHVESDHVPTPEDKLLRKGRVIGGSGPSMPVGEWPFMVIVSFPNELEDVETEGAISKVFRYLTQIEQLRRFLDESSNYVPLDAVPMGDAEQWGQIQTILGLYSDWLGDRKVDFQRRQAEKLHEYLDLKDMKRCRIRYFEPAKKD